MTDLGLIQNNLYRTFGKGKTFKESMSVFNNRRKKGVTQIPLVMMSERDYLIWIGNWAEILSWINTIISGRQLPMVIMRKWGRSHALHGQTKKDNTVYTVKREKPRLPVGNRGSLQRRRLPTLPHCIAVPSAQAGLTSLFGMGRGGTPPR